ncbi:MAG: hypothetical protein FWG21_03700 [Oscillospiraceae bacterium]|nr:hypothetical protein [Oscillospiraceae bacterium]
MERKETQYKRGFKEKQKQSELKVKYGIDKEVIVIEKKSTVAQTVKALLSFSLVVLRIIATILIVLLAAIGLTAILYPNIRQELIATLQLIIDEIIEMTGH